MKAVTVIMLLTVVVAILLGIWLLWVISLVLGLDPVLPARLE